MPEMKRPADILKFVTRAELERRYVIAYMATGEPSASAIDHAKRRVAQLERTKK